MREMIRTKIEDIKLGAIYKRVYIPEDFYEDEDLHEIKDSLAIPIEKLKDAPHVYRVTVIEEKRNGEYIHINTFMGAYYLSRFYEEYDAIKESTVRKTV